MSDVNQLNTDLAHALGVVDTQDVQDVTLEIRACKVPIVKVTRIVRHATGLEHVMREYEIVDRARDE